MRKFTYLKPKTIEEACFLLSKYRTGAKLLAGGTELIVKMKQEVESLKYLIDLKGVQELDHITYDKDRILRIGSLVTLKKLELSPVIIEQFPILAQAAAKVGTPQLRNRGTIGGNICIDSRCLYFNQSSSWKKNLPICFKAGGNVCHVAKGGNRCFAVCCADTVPALIALAAKVRVSSSETQRVIPLEELYRKDGDGRRINNLEANEIITHVEIAAPRFRSGGAYLKIGQRKSFDFPILSVAVVVQLDTECKFCNNVRIVVLAVTPNPSRAIEAEEVLRGREVSEELIQEASKLVHNSVRPISNAGGFAWYRKAILPPMVGRAIRQALETAKTK